MTNTNKPSDKSLPGKITKFLPKTFGAATWMSPTKWAEQAIETELSKRPDHYSHQEMLGELDLPPDTIHHKIIMDDGGEIHVVELGSGPPIILLHGVILSVATWPYQLKELSKSHRVIALDQRGHGRSRPGIEGITLERLAQDLIEVMDALGVKKSVVVGHSMGGMVTMTAVTKYPREIANKISAMVLVATSADPLVNIPGLSLLVSLLSPGIKTVFHLISGRNALANIKPLRYVAARIILGGKPSPSNVEFAQHLIKAASAQILSQLWSQLLVFDVIEPLTRVSLPTMVLVGESDLLTPPWHAIRMVKAITGSELIRFPGCGHMIMFERHKEMNKIILNFAKHVQGTKSTQQGTVAKRRISQQDSDK